MARVRVLMGTRKGAFILSADGGRKGWKIDGPHFGGWEIYHFNGSPVNPDRLYVSQTTGWFGQLLQRSDDAGKSWNPVSNEFTFKGEVGTHLDFDDTPRPWEFKRVWHLEPSLSDPETVFAGIEDAALFRSTDGDVTWQPINRGLHSDYMPEPEAEVGHCVHRLAMHPSSPRLPDRRAATPDTVFRLRRGPLPRFPDAPVPDTIARGKEPFRIVGSVAGG